MKDRGVGPRRMLQVVLTPDVAADHSAPGASPQTRGHLLERTDQGRLFGPPAITTGTGQPAMISAKAPSSPG